MNNLAKGKSNPNVKNKNNIQKIGPFYSGHHLTVS
jgi:hypothetical protein